MDKVGPSTGNKASQNKLGVNRVPNRMISRKISLDKVVSFSSKKVMMLNMRRKSTRVFNLNPGAVELRTFIPET